MLYGNVRQKPAKLTDEEKFLPDVNTVGQYPDVDDRLIVQQFKHNFFGREYIGDD